MVMIFVGLDLETSGIDHDISVPIEFGLAIPTPGGVQELATYNLRIGGWKWADDPWLTRVGQPTWEWNYQSAKIHNITKEELENVQPVADVDEFVRQILDDHHSPTRNDKAVYCMIGWNVAGFDRPFVEKHMPLTFERFSYRTIDLNAICYALAEPNVRSYDTIKNRSKQYGADKVGGPEMAHQAGWDAATSFYAYLYLRDLVRQGDRVDWM